MVPRPTCRGGWLNATAPESACSRRWTLIEVIVERCRAEEQGVHVLDAGHVPVADVVVEVFPESEQAAPVGHAPRVPLADRPVLRSAEMDRTDRCA